MAVRKPVVHLIDGSVYVFRAYYSLPPMQAPDGAPPFVIGQRASGRRPFQRSRAERVEDPAQRAAPGLLRRRIAAREAKRSQASDPAVPPQVSDENLELHADSLGEGLLKVGKRRFVQLRFAD